MSDASTAAETLRPLLFGDVPIEGWVGGTGDVGEPWTSFRRAHALLASGDVRGATTEWQAVTAMPSLESRHYLQAWTFLRSRGIEPAAAIAANVLAAVADVPVDAGRDLLVAYADGSVRYLNHAGGVSIVEPEAAPEELRSAAGRWLAIAQRLAHQIEVWSEPELPALPRGIARIMMMTPGGPRFGQAPFEVLVEDASAQAFVNAAIALLSNVAGLNEA